MFDKIFPPRFYGRRKGHPLSKHRTRLIEELLPQILLRDPIALDLTKETWLEIGFGNGEHLAEIASQNPHVQLLGCEIFKNGIASLLQHIEKKNLQNICVYPEDVRPLLKSLPPACISKVFILFPDPWPKKKHHKRRLINSSFLDELSRILAPEAELRFASDHEDYAKDVFGLIQKKGHFPYTVLSSQKPDDWPTTAYHQKAIRAGTPIWYLKGEKLF